MAIVEIMWTPDRGLQEQVAPQRLIDTFTPAPQVRATGSRFEEQYMFALIFAAAVSATPPATGLIGVWRADDGSSTVRVAPCGAALCATVVAEQLKPGEATMLGHIAASDIRPAGSLRWTGMLENNGGSPMRGVFRQVTPDRMTLKVCAMVVLCETLRFQRVGR